MSLPYCILWGNNSDHPEKSNSANQLFHGRGSLGISGKVQKLVHTNIQLLPNLPGGVRTEFVSLSTLSNFALDLLIGALVDSRQTSTDVLGLGNNIAHGKVLEVSRVQSFPGTGYYLTMHGVCRIIEAKKGGYA